MSIVWCHQVNINKGGIAKTEAWKLSSSILRCDHNETWWLLTFFFIFTFSIKNFLRVRCWVRSLGVSFGAHQPSLAVLCLPMGHCQSFHWWRRKVNSALSHQPRDITLIVCNCTSLNEPISHLDQNTPKDIQPRFLISFQIDEGLPQLAALTKYCWPCSRLGTLGESKNLGIKKTLSRKKKQDQTGLEMSHMYPREMYPGELAGGHGISKWC